MPTIKDIALAAGVSHATVSNVLNKKGNVSSEKIRLVEETARALGYRIDEQASLLRRGTTRTVAVILPDIRSARYCDLYVGILRKLEQCGYSARLFLTEDDPRRERHAVNSAIAAKACGILAVTCLDHSETCYLVPSLETIPALFLERRPQTDSGFCFYFDHEQGGQILAEKARKDGHVSPRVFVGNLDYPSNRRFLKGVRQEFPDLPDSRVVELKYEACAEEAYQAMGLEDFDCCITIHEEFSHQLYHIRRFFGRDRQVSFYTLSSLRTTQDSRFHCLALNYSRMGGAAAQSLVDSIESGAGLESRAFEASLYYPLHPAVSVSGQQPLRVLSLTSPTASALSCLLPEFQSQTGIRVQLDTQPLSTIYDYIESGNSLHYDVLRMDVSSFDYKAPRTFVPLTDIDPQAGRHFQRFLSGLEDNYGLVDGTLYALPFDISSLMLFYRKDLFENAMQSRSYFEATRQNLKVPETFQEFNQIARFFTQKFRPDSPTPYGTSISLSNPTSAAAEYLIRLLSMGGDRYDETGLLHISSGTAREALAIYLESAEFSAPSLVYSWGQVADSFSSGQQAMAILFANHASGIVRSGGLLSSGQVGFAPVPGSRPLLGGGLLGVCADSGRKEDAYRFIQWATGDEIASRLMIMGGISPCRSAYEHAETLNGYPWLTDFEKNLNLGCRKSILTNCGLHPDIHKFETALGKLIIDAAAGKRQLDETIWRAQMMIEELDHA